ncbi:MAG: glycosyltransferase family 4 protein [bacterium]
MKKHDICIVSKKIPPDFAGGGKRAFNHAKYFAKKGYKVLVLTTTKTYSEHENLEIESIDLPNWFENQGLFFSILRKLYYLIYFLKVYIILNKIEAKIFHCISGGNWLSHFVTLINSQKDNSKVILETTLLGGDDPFTIKKSRLGFLRFSMYKNADAFVNISPSLYKQCEKVNLPEDKIHLIPNSIDTNKYKIPSIEEKNKLREKLNMNEDYIFLYVGIISERKNVEDLINIFNGFSKKYKTFKLILAGPIKKNQENIKYTNKIKKLINKYGLESKVSLIGEIDNVNEYMKVSDVFVFASKREGFGTVLIEAMGSGLPVITKKIEDITEYIIDDNIDGFIVDNNDDFIEKLLLLVKDEELLKNISLNARNKVMENFSNKIVMGQYLNLYRNLYSGF